MSENLLQTAQKLVQDVISPDVRELKVHAATVEKQIAALDKHMEFCFKALEKKTDVRLDALTEKMDLQFHALLSAISETRAQAELTSMRVVASLSERVAVLEAQRQ